MDKRKKYLLFICDWIIVFIGWKKLKEEIAITEEIKKVNELSDENFKEFIRCYIELMAQFEKKL